MFQTLLRTISNEIWRDIGQLPAKSDYSCNVRVSSVGNQP